LDRFSGKGRFLSSKNNDILWAKQQIFVSDYGKSNVPKREDAGNIDKQGRFVTSAFLMELEMS